MLANVILLALLHVGSKLSAEATAVDCKLGSGQKDQGTPSYRNILHKVVRVVLSPNDRNRKERKNEMQGNGV